MGLTGRFLTANVVADIAASTTSAGTMMERIGGRAQGQMPQRGCGNLFGRVMEAMIRALRNVEVRGAHPSAWLRAGFVEHRDEWEASVVEMEARVGHPAVSQG